MRTRKLARWAGCLVAIAAFTVGTAAPGAAAEASAAESGTAGSDPSITQLTWE